MKRFILLLMALCLLPAASFAEALVFAPDVTGEYTWPEGVPAEEAIYVYRCTYPQLDGSSEAAEVVNTTYQYLMTDAFGFECPMNATSLPLDGPQMTVDITYEVAHHSADYLSIKLTKHVVYGESVTEIVSGLTFPLTGEAVGQAANLPQLLGILDATETDEWYQERQIAKADACVRELVWDMLQSSEVPCYEDLTYEEFEWSFYPEEDFYMDADGDLVFILQAGTVAPSAAGVIMFEVSMEMLLDEI